MAKSVSYRKMCPLMGFLISRVMNEDDTPESHENRTRLGMLAGWSSAVLSILLAAAKGWLGLVSGSVSMVADATNNLTDVASSLVIALGFQWSRKPRDEEHPFGHGRIEAVATLVMAIALVIVGFEVAKSGVGRLIRPQPIESPFWLLVASGLTVGIKVWMAVFARKLAKLTKSPVLEADAWNHFFDVVCTLLVVLALFSARMGWSAVDGWTALGVALFILYTGVSFAKEAVNTLLGTTPEAGEVRQIYEVVVAVDGVIGAHEIMVHQYGDVKMVSFHIEVDAGLSLVDAHLISEEAEEAVERSLQWRAVAHLDPVDRSHVLFGELDQVLRAYVDAADGLVDVHDLRAEGDAEPFSVSFDLVTDMSVHREDYDLIYECCLKVLQEAFKQRVSRAEIGIEAAVECAPMDRRKFDLVPTGK